MLVNSRAHTLALVAALAFGFAGGAGAQVRNARLPGSQVMHSSTQVSEAASQVPDANPATKAREDYVSRLKQGAGADIVEEPGRRISARAPSADQSAAEYGAMVSAANEAARTPYRASPREDLDGPEGILRINGAESGFTVVDGAPLNLSVRGFDLAQGCSFTATLLSRKLPADYAAHTESQFRQFSTGAPWRELPASVTSVDASLCSSVGRPVARALNAPVTLKGRIAPNHGGFPDDPDAQLLVSNGTQTFTAPVRLVAERQDVFLPIFVKADINSGNSDLNSGRSAIGTNIARVRFSADWAPFGAVTPYRHSDGTDIDCPPHAAPDVVEINPLNGFVATDASMLTERTDAGDGDGFGNSGGRVVFGDYRLEFSGDSKLIVYWAIWRSHRSPMRATYGPDGYEVLLHQGHDICLSNYLLSMTLTGPKGMLPW